MGLLEQLLGAAVQGGARGGSAGPSARGGGSPLMAILLQLLTSGAGGAGVARGADPLGGILGGLFGGGGPGGGMARGGGDPLSQLAGALLGGGRGGNGLDGLLAQFRDAGLGAQADSWVGRGENMPLSPHQLETVFGRDRLEGLASRHGMRVDDMLDGLSRTLPGAVDELTPQGRVPARDDLATTIGRLLGGDRRG